MALLPCKLESSQGRPGLRHLILRLSLTSHHSVVNAPLVRGVALRYGSLWATKLTACLAFIGLTRLWSGGIALRDGSLRSSMRLSFQASAWRLKRPLAELMPEKVCFFSAAVSLRTTPPGQRRSNRSGQSMAHGRSERPAGMD